MIDRCENCGVALGRGREIDPVAEWEAICRPGEDGTRAIAIPDRASLQAAIGVEGWAAIELSPGHLLLTRTSLELLAQRNGHRLETCSWPAWGRNQAWMWQTLLNGLTFHPNFAREVRAGRLRPANARSRFAFGDRPRRHRARRAAGRAGLVPDGGDRGARAARRRAARRVARPDAARARCPSARGA